MPTTPGSLPRPPSATVRSFPDDCQDCQKKISKIVQNSKKYLAKHTDLYYNVPSVVSFNIDDDTHFPIVRKEKKGEQIMTTNRYFACLALVASTFFSATNVRASDSASVEELAEAIAQTLDFKFVGVNDQATNIAGLLDSLSLTAEHNPELGNTGGVTFTFISNYTDGSKSQAGGAGKIFGNEFFLYNTDDVFAGSGNGISSGGGIQGGGNIWSSADYTAVTSGYSQAADGSQQVSFTLTFAEGKTWEDFIVAVESESGGFTVGTHLQALSGGISAKVVSGIRTEAEGGSGTPDNTIPEPATLMILGLGLAGLGVARHRMKK